MTEPEMPMVERVAKTIFGKVEEDMSPEWCDAFWTRNAAADHASDCPHVERPYPMTCARCVVDEFREQACAAIQAMRIPTDQSVIAAEEWYRKSKTERTWDEMFTVMVDSMLKEDEA